MRYGLTMLMLVSMACGRTFALDMSEQVSFDIPPQRLASALLEFSHQAGVQVIVGQDVAEQTTTGIKGRHTIGQALEALLQHTTLRYSVVSESAITIGAAGAEVSSSAEGAGDRVRLAHAGHAGADDPSASAAGSEIETINVFGTLEDRVGVGSKTGSSLRETPKSVTIVTRERIEAQNLTTLVDVMNQATGITVRTYGPVEAWYMSRGYRIGTTQLDGGAPISAGFGNVAAPDSAMFERVEVLRGVDGMFSGAGDPGGVINLVRKRAPRSSDLSVTATAGRWDNYRAELDAGGPLAFDGALRGRFVGVYHDQDFFWDRATSDRRMFYGVLEGDVGAAVLSLGGSYEHRDEKAVDMSGLPSYSDGRDIGLPRSTNLAPDWAFRDVTTHEIFAKADVPLSESVSLRLNVTRQEQDAETAEMYISGAIDPLTGIGSTGLGGGADQHSRRTLADLFVGGKFELFSRQHAFAMGADYARMDGGGGRTYQYDAYPWGLRGIDVFDYDPDDFPASPRTPTYLTAVNRQTQRGVYATLGMQLADPLRLVLGARHAKYEIEGGGFALNPDGSLGAPSTWPASYRESAFVPSAALVLDLAERWSAYASYAQTFNPQGSRLQAPLPGTPLDPITGDGYEIGVKGTPLDGINVAVALYRVRRNGEGLQDPAYPWTPADRGASCCYISLGDTTTEGLDVELSGRISATWQLFAGYTHTRPKYEDEVSGTESALLFNWTPRHLFKLWTTWDVPGSRWTLNAGVNAQSSFAGYTFDWLGAGPPRQSGYALWNASARYRVTDDFSVSLYAENLFDKVYYQSLGLITGDSIYGTPRNVTLRLNMKF